MKKFLLTCTVLILGALCLSAGIHRIPAYLNKKKTPQAACVGFTVLEATKGVNCQGDTVRLKKVNGFYAIAD